MSEPRRYKLPSELTDDERTSARNAFGGSGRVETDRYIEWRRETLKTEHDDLALRRRLLEEESERLRARAVERQTAALETVTVEEWLERDAAKGRGEDVELPADERAVKWEARAAELESEAQEIEQHMADGGDVSMAEHIDRIGARR